MLRVRRNFPDKRTVAPHLPQHQRGFLLIMAVVLIVIAALVLSVMVFFSTTGNQATTRHMSSKQALFIAESGIEKGIREWKLNPAYTGEANTPFSYGTFTVVTSSTDFSGAPLPTGQLRFISTGTTSSGLAERVAEAIAGPENLLPTSANADFNNPPGACSPPCSPTNWTLFENPPGSFVPWDDTGGPDGTRAAYAEKLSPGPSTATNAGNFTFNPPVTVFAPVSLQMTFDYLVIRSSPGGPNNELQLTFTLSDGVTTWTSIPAPFLSGHTGTYQQGTVTFNITGSGTTLLTNLSFTMFLKSGQPKRSWLDNLVLQTGVGPPNMEIKAWREDYQ